MLTIYRQNKTVTNPSHFPPTTDSTHFHAISRAPFKNLPDQPTTIDDQLVNICWATLPHKKTKKTRHLARKRAFVAPPRIELGSNL